MKNFNLANEIPVAINRYFKINRDDRVIDTSESFSILDDQVSREYFENEIYKVTFTTLKETYPNTYELFISSNELINDDDINSLKETLGIEIAGDGCCFEIIDQDSDFSLQFDQENSFFINTPSVKEGYLLFKNS